MKESRYEASPRVGYPQIMEPPYESVFEAEIAVFGVKMDAEQRERYREYIRANPLGGPHRNKSPRSDRNKRRMKKRK